MDIETICSELTQIKGNDFSSLKILLQLSKKEFSGVSFAKCNFDHATSFRSTSFNKCEFSNAKLSGDFTDVSFNGCNFSNSTFKGGHNEYGFTRCRFTDCDLKNIIWNRPFFKSVEFHNCNFSESSCKQGYFSGFKTFQTTPVESFFTNGDIKSRFHDGVKLKFS